MQPLAQPPNGSDAALTRWLFLLWKRINSAGGIAWYLIDKTGSNLTDIVTRNHNDLQNIQGGTAAQYYHITSVQSSLIPSGTPTAGQVPVASSGTASAWGNNTAYALKSATTVIDVSAATAPTAGQVLTAASGTAATWQTPTTISLAQARAVSTLRI